MAAQSAPELSIVLPAYTELENIPPLAEEVHAALISLCHHELIFIDNGSSGSLQQQMKRATAVELPRP